MHNEEGLMKMPPLLCQEDRMIFTNGFIKALRFFGDQCNNVEVDKAMGRALDYQLKVMEMDLKPREIK